MHRRSVAQRVSLIVLAALFWLLACDGLGSAPAAAIVPDNVGAITQIARWGTGTDACAPAVTGCGIKSLAFSPDGQFLVSGEWDGTVRLRRTADGTELWAHREQGAVVITVAFSPDGAVVAAGSGQGDDKVRLWRASDGELLQTWDQPVMVDVMSFSPDGRILAVPGETHSINLWQVHDGTLWRTLEPPEEGVDSLAFAPDGQSLAASVGRGVYIWQMSDGALLHTITPKDGVVRLAFLPDGQSVVLVTTARPGIWRWHISDDTLTRHDFPIPRGYEGFSGTEPFLSVNMWSGSFSPDRQVFAAGATDGVIWLWRIGDGKIVRTLTGHTAQVSEIAFSADGKLMVSGAEDGTIRLWGVR